MNWGEGIDISSGFRGITTPVRELMDEIHSRGWDVQKVDINGDNLYEATAKNPYGEAISRVGPDPNTALGHILTGIMRIETMRYPRIAAWDHTWEPQLAEIAKAYAKAPTYDPKAASAWKELGEDSVRRAEEIARQLNVEYVNDPYPYEDVNEMAKDIGDKQRVKVSKANLSHPLWSTQQALAYRLVHDVLGHAQVGGDWGWHGENGATRSHAPLLSPAAQKALFTEAIGQSAHNHFYRTIGPQKIAFLDDFIEPAQDAENNGFGGIHPSQSIVQTQIPSIEPDERTSATAPTVIQTSGDASTHDAIGHDGVIRQPFWYDAKGDRLIVGREGQHHGQMYDDPEWPSDIREDDTGGFADCYQGQINHTPWGSQIEYDNPYNSPPKVSEVEAALQPFLTQGPYDQMSIKEGSALFKEPEPWLWGNWGKGFIDPTTNETVVWKVNGKDDLSPHHTQVAAHRHDVGLDEINKGIDLNYSKERYYHSPITIAPNGQYVSSNDLNGGYVPDGEEGRFEREYTPLRYRGDTRDWSTDNQGYGGGYGHARIIGGTAKVDPNYGWESGIDPLPDNAYLWQREESGLDPLDWQGVRDQSHGLGDNWYQLHDHDGNPDLASQRQAVINAFRSALLSSRQTPRWSATHYQHLRDIPASVSDPLRFTEALNVQRDAHNQSRGLPEGFHKAEWLPQETALRSWVKGMNPNLDDAEVNRIVNRELFHMIAEEEERIIADDPGAQLLPAQIHDGVNKALGKRLTVATKPRIDHKFDFGRGGFAHKAFVGDPTIYGDFLHSHIRPIAGAGLHSDDIVRAARDDVSQHGGKGHHFRAQVSDLVPGIDSQQISRAWHLLQPHTSDLGVITPSIQDALGYGSDEPSIRDYYKMERQLAAARDSAGYTHIPLGAFSQGLHDYLNYGHGAHTDLSPLRPINPTPYDQVDWSQYPSSPTQDLVEPYWLKSTQPNRDQVGDQWDQMVAVNNPADQIPYRTAGMTGPQRQRMIEQWDAHQPDTSEIVHEFPNGYTIRKLNTWGDKRREGQLMRNCWADPMTADGGTPDYNAPIAYPDWPFHHSVDHYSLRDEYNFPHVSFFHEPTPEAGPSLTGMAKGFYGHGNAEVSPEYRAMIEEWRKANNVHINPNEWRGNRPISSAPYEYDGPDLTNGQWSLPQSARGVLRAPYITHPESGEIIEGDPNHSLMQHAKNSLGLTTEEIWAADPEIGRR